MLESAPNRGETEPKQENVRCHQVSSGVPACVAIAEYTKQNALTSVALAES